MKIFVQSQALAALLLMAVTMSVEAATPEPACQQVVQSLKNEWKVVDFPTPSKPTAIRVEGRLGHENTAGQIAYMQDQIKKADADCKGGNQQAALQRVSSVHDLLDSHGISEETANAAMAPQ